MGMLKEFYRDVFKLRKTIIKKKVYCTNCKYYKKEQHDWWVEGVNDYSNRWNHMCNHPINLKGKVRSYDSFEKRHTYTDRPDSPMWVNQYNKCGWYHEKDKKRTWEV